MDLLNIYARVSENKVRSPCSRVNMTKLYLAGVALLA